MWKIEAYRLAEALSAALFGAAVAYGALSADLAAWWWVGALSAGGLVGAMAFGSLRDGAIRNGVYDDAERAAAGKLESLQMSQAPWKDETRAMPEHAQALRGEVAAGVKDICARLRQLDIMTGDLLLDHLDAHDLRRHAEQKTARLEGVLERVAAARRALEADPGPEPLAPVARLEAKRAVEHPEASLASTEVLERLHQELQAGGLPQ